MAKLSIIRKAVKDAVGEAEQLAKEAPKPKKKPIKKGKITEFEGARANPDTLGSDKIARDVEAGFTGEVTFGKAVGFLEAQRTPSSKAVAKVKADLQKIFQEGSDATAAQKTKARKLYRQLEEKDALDTMSARAKGADTARANNKKPKPARTDYVDPETGEIFGKPTKNAVQAALRNARARNMTAREREYKAYLEKEYGVEFNKGGVVKSNKGSHDYRMNKGGLLLSSVDNRRKKK
tara:strand:- start:269 stop:976 length:708 start_codon:yes stop_codon:yes gene_type:complete